MLWIGRILLPIALQLGAAASHRGQDFQRPNNPGWLNLDGGCLPRERCSGKFAQRQERQPREVAFKQALVDKLTHELATLKRLKFAAASEKFCAGLSAEQRSLVEAPLDADIAEAAGEIVRASRGNLGKSTSKARSASR